MNTVVIATLLVSAFTQAAPPDLRSAAVALVAQTPQSEQEIERRLRELERERERLERERERQRQQREKEQERAERDRERAREQAERDRERAQTQAERERERARSREGRIEEVERLTRTFRIGTTGELHLSNIAGDIVISRGTGSDAQVEIIKTARGETREDALEMLKLVEIDVVERPTRAEVTTRYPHGDEWRRNRRNLHVSVAFNVTVPPATRLRVTSISGSVNAKDVRGDSVLKSVSGAVRLTGGGGACTAESVSGTVEVLDSSFDGAMTASTASGGVTLRRVKARRIGANSISGGVILEAAESPTVEAKSVSGTVQLTGGLGTNSRYELGSHSGSLNVAVGSAAGFEVQATTFSGGIRSDFQFSNGSSDDGRGRFGRSLRGVVGNGGAVLNLSTFSGSISIVKR